MVLFYGREINRTETNESPSVPDAPVEYTLPLASQQPENTLWSQGGDWEYLIESVLGNIHQIHFKNARPQSIIDMVFLEKNYNNEMSITFKVNRDYFSQLCEYLVSKGYDRPVGSDAVVCFFRFMITRSEAQSRFTSFLADASLADPDLLLVNERILSVINNDLSKVYAGLEEQPLSREDISDNDEKLLNSLDFIREGIDKKGIATKHNFTGVLFRFNAQQRTATSTHKDQERIKNEPAHRDITTATNQKSEKLK